MPTKLYRTEEELRQILDELKAQSEELKGIMTFSELWLLYRRGYRVVKI